MTDKRFWCLDEYKGETSPIVDGKFAPTNEWLCNKLNELYEEKEIAIEGIQIANNLIMKYGSEKLKHEWKKNVRVKE